MKNKYIAWFEEVGKDDVDIVGGKGANLGEMLSAKFPVPYGFVVTSHAYFYFIEHNKLDARIKNRLKNVNIENTKELGSASDDVKKMIMDAKVPADLLKEIIAHYEDLLNRQEKIFKKLSIITHVYSQIKTTFSPPLVAVRSSATAEDLPTASFAGQQETFLNVKGENHLVQKVRECWASLFTERAIYYRHHQGFDHVKVGLAAVVQLMVQSEKSGIAFSIDPVTNDKSTLTIEAILGLGEYIVQGKVTPDHYEVDKKTLSIKKRDTRYQQLKYVKKGTENAEVKLSKKEGEEPKLTDREILDVAKLVKAIEAHYYFPQDIEWAMEKDRVYIVQSRPITTTGSGDKKATTADEAMTADAAKNVLLTCDPASPGMAYGRPVVLQSPKENDKIKQGDILVTTYTSPDYVPAMKRASAIVTEMGGRTSHAAIVSRELGIPAVVGADNATKVLKKETMITVNGTSGIVYRGNVMSGKAASAKAVHKKLKTVTKIYVNLAQPEAADRVAKLDTDGIGLLRAEFILADIGIHPKLIIKQKKQAEFIKKLTDKLLLFAKPFSPRPITYRATDFRTNEYRHLKGGEDYEPHEENPMIGFRGASRYIANVEVFAMELQAIKNLREMGYKNINLMIPFIRTPQELIQIRSILKEHDLLDKPSFKLWIMVEVPSSAIMIEEMLKIGVDGVSIGTNDLTMLILGVDRDNQEISYLYDERNAAVLWAIERVIKACKKYGKTVSVCGQAPSDYPEFAEKLVNWGVTSMSLTPDVVERTRELVHGIEKNLWQKSKK